MNRKLASKILISAITIVVTAEFFFHLFPRALPASYRASFPVSGMALDHPDILRETGLRSVPLPLGTKSYRGPPLSDLVDLFGVAPESATALDHGRWPRIDLPIDDMGFPNAATLERADIVLVGDSFMVSAGSIEPKGLAGLLADDLGQSVYNLGVSAIGPLQELDLLLHQGLPKHPAVVVWFFFGGNDLVNVREVLFCEKKGKGTWAEFYEGRLRPRLILADLIRFYLGGSMGEFESEAADPFLLPNPNGPESHLWFAPPYLLGLALSGSQIQGLPSWQETRQALREARDATLSEKARFLLVYLPSKAQVYLPYVETDAALVSKVAGTGGQESHLEPERLLRAMLQNRMGLENLVEESCRELGIKFLSATPALEALAKQGKLGYLRADTHWDATGQQAILPELRDAIQTLLDKPAGEE